MTDREKLLRIFDQYKVDSMEAILECYLDIYWNDISIMKICGLIKVINNILPYKMNDASAAIYESKERALYLREYLSGNMWETEEAAKANVLPQINNAQAIIDACKRC